MIYRLIRFLVKIFLKVRFRLKIEGLENIPEGACILAMNHTSNYDSLIVGTHTPRKMHIMAKEELFKRRFFSYIISEMGAFPVKRGQADLRSIKYTLKILKSEGIFSIFFEGSRTKTGEIQEGKKGIGFIASRSKAPVVPTYVYGAKNGWFKPAGVIFGEPLTFEEGLEYEQITLQITNEIKKLINKK